MNKPRVTGSPDELWLVYGDLECDATHQECNWVEDGVTWCEDKQYESDVRYIRADKHEDTMDELKSALAAALTELEAYWEQVDGEWGPSGKTLNEECADGEQPVIELVRKLVKGI